MGPCILIGQHCHVLNNQTLMNHFPFGREKEKSISLRLDIIPVLHIAHDGSAHKSQQTLLRLQRLVYASPTSLPRSPPLCLSYPSLLPSFSTRPSLALCCVAVIFHRGELAEAVNTPLLRLRTQSDPATSMSLMPLPRSLIPRPLWSSSLAAAQTL